MKSIIVAYQGNDPIEFEKIKKVFDDKNINFYKSAYYELYTPLDPLEKVEDRILYMIIPWQYRPKYLREKLLQRAGEGFQITILQKDEDVVKRLLEKLELSRELCPKNASRRKKIFRIFNKIAVPLTAYLVILGLFIFIAFLFKK